MEHRKKKIAGLSLLALLFAGLGGLVWGSPAPLSHAAVDGQHTDWTHTDGAAKELNANALGDSSIIDEYGVLATRKYYLSEALTLEQSISIESEVEICLNGYQLNVANGSISISEGGKLTLHDCQESGTEGKITGATDSAISVYGVFIMEGGTISGNTLREYSSGGAVNVYSGSFTMNGGTISENSADNGGGVYIKDGSFTMNGGEITNNTATGSSQIGDELTVAGGGGVYVEYGTVEISGGTISGNSAANGHGGGILLNATKVHYGEGQVEEEPSITFTLSGDAVIANNTAKSGGGVAAFGKVTATMSGGVIGGKAFADGTVLEGNKATDTSSDSAGGGGVYIAGTSLELNVQESPQTVQLSPTFTMSGGTIGYETEPETPFETVDSKPLGNSGLYGGGVYVGENSTFTLEEGGVIGFAITQEQYEGGLLEENPQSYPYGNTAVKEYNASGGAVCIYNNAAKFMMTGGTVSYNTDSYYEASGILVMNDPNREPETPSVFECSGGTLSYHPAGAVYVRTYASAFISGETLITENGTGIQLYPSGFGVYANATVTGGTITKNNIGIEGYGESTLTIGGTATITGNPYGGVKNVSMLTLSGTPTISENGLDAGYPSNLVINSGASADVSGLTGGEIHITVGGRSPFTKGYRAGVENYLRYDGYDNQGQVNTEAKISVVTDENGEQELALTYRITFKDKDSELEIDALSGDYIAETRIEELFCEYHYEDGSVTLREDVLALLVKAPDAENHYTFAQLLQEDGTPYDFNTGYYSLAKNTTIQVEFTSEAHDWSEFSETEGGEEHTHHCNTCLFAASEAHNWGDWINDGNGNHSRVCTDGCGAEETSAHT